ncbi:nucleoside monophosphate kinase [Nodosilinea sp. LEGE 06152]|uniref:nucleoside monophosphate kinase n=1 Tax=Nodosilinea sp. LEGE 06152 TaxID=2777966 RepID=UPI001881739D|nr:nucleoside monophosphate kinase [Nodosilinea sp. LEGE 06152]MBE9157455.1 nucleoside monophosphate kinase [Nodosilinea sp. LEGE 06152]
MRPKQLILLGLPRVGVRAQAAALAERWQVPYVSMAELLREAIAKETAIGVEARPYVDADELVPDALVTKLIRKRFEQPDTMLKGWVLDGFPRTLTQAQEFDQWWTAVGQPPATVAYLKATTEFLIIRVLNEAGDKPPISAIRDRLERYQQALEPLIKYYQQQSQLATINASLPFAEVASALAQLGQEDTGAAKLIRDEAELDALLAREPLLVVDCMASWCGSCKQVTPSIDKLAETYGDSVAVRKIDFDTNRQITKRFELKGIPAVMFFKDGERLETLTGIKSYQEYSAAVTRLLA